MAKITDLEDDMADKSTCENASTCEKSSCEGCSGKSGIPKEKPAEGVKIGKIIGVVSGKGGVGKSFVTGSIAAALCKKGFKVGILDGDITGPSIPRMFGLSGTLYGDEDGNIVPMDTPSGIKIISMNLLMDNEESPVIWRGPVIAGTLKQFYTNAAWGELDYLLVDMPPGTGDVPLTVFQSFPVDGIVIVTSPQELVGMIVKKAVNMAAMMNIKVFGIVENFSYIECPDCGRKIFLFGESRVDDVAAELNIPVLAKLPIEPRMSGASDSGKFFEEEYHYFDEVVDYFG